MLSFVMLFTVTRRGQAYCFVGGKKILSGMKAAANINITLGAQDHGQECIKEI